MNRDTLKIPGLIAREKDANAVPQKKQSGNQPLDYNEILKSYIKDREEDIQAKHKQEASDLNDFANYAQSSIGYVPTSSEQALVSDPEWLVNQQYQQSIGNQFFDRNRVYGPPPYDPNKALKNRESASNYLQMMEMIKNQSKNPPLSQFEIMIDSLFSPIEKLEFLKSLGYEHVEGDKVRFNKPSQDNLIGLIETVKAAFLYEITKKFKGMLLAKGTIKIKF